MREIDFYGLKNAQQKIPLDQIVSFFIKPNGGINQLVKQLQGYEGFSKTELEERLKDMGDEFSNAHLYDEILYAESNKTEALVKLFEEKIESHLL